MIVEEKITGELEPTVRDQNCPSQTEFLPFPQETLGLFLRLSNRIKQVDADDTESSSY